MTENSNSTWGAAHPRRSTAPYSTHSSLILGRNLGSGSPLQYCDPVLEVFRRALQCTATQPVTATGSDETCRLVPAQLHRGHRASVDVRTTHTARGFEVARAKMVAFGHPNHHTRQPVGDGGTAQCLWHSAVGTRGTAPLSALAGCGTGPRRGRSGRVWQLLR